MKSVNIILFRTTFCILFLAIFIVSFLLMEPGCHRHKAPEDASPSAKTDSSDAPSNSENLAYEQVPENKTANKLDPTAGLSPEQLLREMITAYSRCKTYSDSGYIELIYETKENPRKELRASRTPCSVVFKKPNQVRVSVNDGEIYSDGKKLHGRIHQPIYSKLTLEQTAPMLISSIKDLYIDPRLASAMDMKVPSNIFWAPPQLVLLLSKEPLKTFIPKESSVKLIEPAYASIFDEVKGTTSAEPCDRIQIIAEDGIRTLWISRKDKSLVRFEFPLEQIFVPENIHRVVRLSLEIPNRTVSPDALKLESEEAVFSPKVPEKTESVRNFIPFDLFLLGKKAPSVRFKALFSGFSDIFPNETDGKCRVICFWNQTALLPKNYMEKGSYPKDDTSGLSIRSQKFLNELDQLAERFEDNRMVEFISVCVDPTSTQTNDVIRSQYGLLDLPLPLYRLEMDDIQNSLFSTLAFPSLMIVNSKGIIQKYYQSPVSIMKLAGQLKKILEGQDVYREEFVQYESDRQRFLEAISLADLNDLYRTVPETVVSDVPTLPLSMPKKIKLESSWILDTLQHPGNPLPLSKKKDQKEKYISNDDLLLVPSDGNSVAVVSSRGKVLQKLSPPAALGEPVTFVRASVSEEGQPLFAASSLLESRVVHTFDGNFKNIGSINIAEPNEQRVADIRIADIDRNGRPELLLGLAGNTTSNTIPVHGLYAVDVDPQKDKKSILWKDEQILTPYRIGVDFTADGNRRLIAMNHPDGLIGNIVVDDLEKGDRAGKLQIDSNYSVLWFHADRMAPKEGTEIAAFIAQINSPKIFFAGISPKDAKILWKYPIPETITERQMERIVSGDINSDGIKEWIVLLPGGSILFFDRKGELLDRFQYGKEITGACVAQWDGHSYLVVTDINHITAWKIRDKNAGKN
ncbi:MAG: hypothetical protein Q4G69_09095 [Planctomycetia bacterium]|nr:hypothetical protein [Planctomycetia bacterium]